MLLCCSALTTGKQYFGSNIHCMTDHSAVNMAVFESWCFMSGTYSIPHYRHNFSRSHNHAYPGVSTGDVSRDLFLMREDLGVFFF